MSYLARSKKLWFLLFAVRALALLIGLDRLPMVPTVYPEVIINDPAVSLSRGHGYVAFSLEHSVNGMDRLYAHFPPIFLFLQSFVFRVFGFSAISLRALSVLFDLATCFVFLLIANELVERKILDRLGATLAGVLILAEPTALIHSREGRMESMNTFLGGLAFLLCLRAAPDGRVSDGRVRFSYWLAAGAAIGIALGAHPAAALMWVVFAAWSLVKFRRLGFFRWALAQIAAAVAMVAAWLAAYGRRIGDAFAQLRHLSPMAGAPTLRVVDLVQGIRHGAITEAQNAGGLGLILTFLMLPLAVWSLASERPAPAPWRRAFLTLLGAVVVQLLMVDLLIPTSGMNRAVMIFPFSLLCLGAAASWLDARLRGWITAAAALAFLLDISLTGGYLLQLRHGWQGRSPDRFDPIISAIPAGARVAGPPEMWYGFLHRDRQFALVYRADGEDAYWNSPDAFNGYDVVILDPNWPEYAAWRAKAERGRPVSKMVHTYSRDFLVLEKSLNGN